MNRFSKWVACWGNATSITDQKEAMYSKNITLRYPVFMCFDGDALRFHFSNLTGTEAITISKATVANAISDKAIDINSVKYLTFDGNDKITIEPGTEVICDEIEFEVTAGNTISVSIYLEDYTQMNSGVLITGPLSKGFYGYGEFTAEEEMPMKLSRKTNWFYFLNTIDVRTLEENKAIICYGDSITAQSWPDYLIKRAWDEGYRNISIIRRAVSGTRILREYDNITYAAYGLKGSKRFSIEMDTAGAESVIIQHGINDIIHPVGVEVNPFRPWSDMPTVSDLIEGMEEIYLSHTKRIGLKTYCGTLLPIFGWRTYTPTRDEIRCNFNQWMLSCKEFDGYIDFDKAVRDPDRTEMFAVGYDSGDHLHPSEAAYERMAMEVPLEELAK